MIDGSRIKYLYIRLCIQRMTPSDVLWKENEEENSLAWMMYQKLMELLSIRTLDFMENLLPLDSLKKMLWKLHERK